LLLLWLLQVAAYVRTRTLDEVLLMVKEHQGASSTRMKAQEDWKGAAKKRAEVTSDADQREHAFTDVQVSSSSSSSSSVGQRLQQQQQQHVSGQVLGTGQ
jgi:DnaJ family protein C protein 2